MLKGTVNLKHGTLGMPANMTANRYELKELLGEGGMGVVYKALDTRTNTYVALKTLRDGSDPATLEMFKREWAELAKLCHPNIVDVRDVDEIEENGVKKPCFIMPLLPGVTLAQLIKSSSPRVTPEFVVNVICQVCKGLQAAHEKDLIHRDLKPSNIFIMNDDTAKLIDFGLVHAVGSHSVTGLKGTWQYMAPEQVEGKPPTRACDIFSLGIVAYEALTGHQPFKRNKLDDTVEALKHFVPQAISERNPKVPQLLSKAVHVAMAKQPIHRYTSAREFSETLQKALNSQYLERFDPAKIRPRIDRAKRAFQGGDSDFASEILTELEAEGNLDSDITLLRSQINEFNRQKRVRQLFEAAQTRLEQEEIPLALEKLDEILKIDPESVEAKRMRRRIEEQRSQQQASDWLKLARQHLDRHDFRAAHQALKEVFNLKYDDPEAAELKALVDAREKEVEKARSEKEQLYSSALRAHQNGEISSALSKLERILDLSRSTPGASVPERDKVFQTFYNDIRTERDRIDAAYAEGTRHLNDKNFAKALEMCDGILARYPQNPQFQAMRLKVEHAQRQELSAYIAEVGHAVDTEPNLDRRVGLLEDACKRYPSERQFQGQLSNTRELRDLVASILLKARTYEEQGQFGEAIAQWNTLANIHPHYPGIDFEVSQLERRREHQIVEDKKYRLVEQIDRALENSAYGEAERLSQSGLQEFPNNPEILALQRLARQGLERTREANRLFEEAKAQRAEGALDKATELLHQALDLDKRNIVVQNTLVNLLVERAHGLLDTDWSAAEPLAAEASELDPEHPSVRKVNSLLEQAKRRDSIDRAILEARELQSTDVKRAKQIVTQALRMYPGDGRLLQALTGLQNQEAYAAGAMATRSTSEGVGPDAATALFAEGLQTQPIPQAPPRPFVVPPKPVEKSSPGSLPLSERLKGMWAPVTAKINGLMADNPNRGAILGVGLGLLMAGIVLTGAYSYLNRGHVSAPPPPPPTKSEPLPILPKDVAVSLVIDPPDATVRLNGTEIKERTLSLKSGQKYQVSVVRPGYKSVESTLEATGKPWPFSLEAERLHLSVAANGGTVWLDDRQEGTIGDGAWAGDYPLKATDEQHVLSLRDRSGTAVFNVRFTAAAGKAAVVGPVKTKDLMVVSSLGKNATLFSGNTNSVLASDGQPRRVIPAGGVVVNLDDAPDGFEIVNDKKHRAWRVAESKAPTISVSLNAAPNIAAILITSPQKSAVLTIDKEPQRAKKPGVWSWNVIPGLYTAKMSAPGMVDETFQIRVGKGQAFRKKVDFKAAGPTLATLVIAGATGGAVVSVDDAEVGALNEQGSGSFSVAPGPHVIRLEKDGYESRTFSHRIDAGKFNLPGNLKLSLAMAHATFSISPAQAAVRYRRTGDPEWHDLDTRNYSVPQGSYDFSADAAGYVNAVVTHTLEAGKTTPVSIVLKPIEEDPSASIPFANKNEVKKVDTWYTGISRNYVSVRPGFAKNTILFLKAQKQKRLSWRVLVDDQNSLTYALDSHKLTITKFIGGARTSTDVLMDLTDSATAYAFVIETSGRGVRVSKRDGKLIDETPDDKHDWGHARLSIKGDALFTVWLGR